MSKECTCSFCKKPNWISQVDFYRLKAKFLGYPKCCTDAFIDDYLKGRPVHKIRIKAGKHNQPINPSFVPCLWHANRILHEKKSINRIFRKRISSYAFPYSSDVEFREYVRNFRKTYENNKTKN
jgi:hypothetical protein